MSRKIWLSGTSARAVMLLAIASLAMAGDAPQPGALRFRRVLIPAARLADWPREPGVEYVPVPAEEFERLVERAGMAGVTQPPAARVARADYQLRLLNSDELAGTAVFTIESDSAATLLEFDTGNLAVREAHWEGEDQPAVLGLDFAGKRQLLVSGHRALRVDFTLRCRAETNDLAAFDLVLPRSPINHLEWTLPADRELTCSHGRLQPPQATAGGEVRTWSQDLGGQSRFRARLAMAQLADSRGPQVTVRQATTYDLSERGVEVAVRLDFDPRREPLSRLQVRLDPGLKLLTARHGTRDVAFRALPDDPAGQKYYMLEFAEPLVGISQAVQLSAVGPLKTDEAWRLPTLQAEGVDWQEGIIVLIVPAGLEVQELTASGCRQSKTASLPSRQPGESIELQAFRADAQVEVRLAEKRERILVESGSAVQLGAGETVGTLVASFRAAAGSHFVINAQLAPQWTIDSVVSDVPGLIADWEVELHEFPRRALHVQLSTALSPANPIRLMISGRRLRSPLGETLSLDDLRMAAFPEAVATDRLFMVSAEGSYEIKLSNADGLSRLDPARLEAGLTELFTTRPGGLLFRDDAHADGLQIALERQSTRFSSRVRVEATIIDDELQESYFIRCPATVAHNERLLVTFSSSRSIAPRWSDADGQPVEATRLDSSSFGGAGSETWEVSLPAASEDEIELRAVRSLPFAAEMSISLAAVPEASSQEGRVYVRGESGEASAALDVVGVRLEPLPVPADAPLFTLAAFRYDPSIDASSMHAPQLRVAPLEPNQSPPAAIVWAVRTQTCLQPGAVAGHFSSVQIENRGLSMLELNLPADAVVKQVSIDGVPSAWPTDGMSPMRVPLPAGRRFVSVAVEFTTPLHGYSLSPAIVRPELHVNVPQLASSWTVFAPPNYAWLPGNAVNGATAETLSWSQRLFGWLARAPGVEPFNPLKRDAWRRLIQPGGRLREQREMVTSFLTLLGATGVPSQPATWQERLVELDEKLGRSGWSLLIDHAACAASGLNRQELLSIPPGDVPLDLASGLLNRHRLGLLVKGNSLILTSLNEAALWGEVLASELPVAFLASDALPASAAIADAREIASGFCHPAAWPQHVASPWIDVTSVLDANEISGWNGRRFTGPLPARVTAIQKVYLIWLWWGPLAAVLALGWRRAASALPQWWLAVGGLGSAALLLPAGWMDVASGAFWGALVCVLHGIYLISRPKPPASSDNSHRAKRMSLAVTAGGLLVAWCWGGLSAAISAEQPAGNPRSRVHAVLIPQQEEGEDRDDDPLSFYRVPKEFLAQLKHAAAAASRQPSGWLLCRSDYRAAWSWDKMHRQTRSDGVKARLRFHVFAPGKIKIALGDGGGTQPTHALLDGIPTPLEWAEDGQSVSFAATQPGDCVVELELHPVAQSSAGIASAALAVPAVAQAVVEVMAPADAPAITIGSSTGPQVAVEGPKPVPLWLGPTVQLSLQWADHPTAQPIAAAWDIEELLWLQVQPGSVVLDCRLKINVASGSLRQFAVSIDPRWRLLPQEPQVAAAGAFTLRTSPDSLQLIEVAFERGVTEQAVVSIRLFLADSSGFGALRPPRMDLPGARSVKRFLAVSADLKTMKWRERGDLRQVLAIPDFLARWGETELQPQIAYQVPDGDFDFSLETEPVPARFGVRDNLAYSVARGKMAVQYQAEILQLSGTLFQYQLQVPRDLQIESLTVREPAGAISARWSRESEEMVTLLLRDPPAANQTIDLIGSVPVPTDGAHTLPRLTIASAETTSTRLQVFRQPAVLIDIATDDRWTALADATVDSRGPDFGRLVGSYESQVGGPAPGIAIRANAPRVTRRQVTALEREERGTWVAECRLQLDVEAGLVDEIRWKVPLAWPGPFQLEPPVTHQLLNVPGENYRQLLLRPRAAIIDQFQVTVRGPWQIAQGSRPRAPIISALLPGDASDILVLPRQLALQPVDWDVRGMQPVDLPTGLPSRFIPEAFQAYRATADGPDAVLRQTEPEEGDPVVTLGDVRLVVERDGNYRGIATFDLTPSGQSTCALQLPEVCRLLACRVSGTAAAAVSVPGGRWRVPLASNRLAQQLEVLFVGRAVWTVADRRATLGLPEIADWKTLQTIVTLSHPTASRLAVSSAATKRTPDQLDLIRLQGSFDLIDASAKLLDHEFPPELNGWRDDWLASCHEHWSAIQAGMADPVDPAARKVTDSDLRKMAAGLSRVAGELHASWPPTTEAGMSFDDLGSVWSFQGGLGWVAARIAVAGVAAPLVVEGLSDTSWESWLWRIGVASLLLAGASGIAALFRKHGAAAASSRIWLLAAAAACWLWLTPAIGGPILVLLYGLRLLGKRLGGFGTTIGRATSAT